MDVIDKTLDAQERIEGKVKKVGKGKYGRVLQMARKPHEKEYIKTMQITGAGIILIGSVGFAIYWLWNNFYQVMIDLLGL